MNTLPGAYDTGFTLAAGSDERVFAAWLHMDVYGGVYNAFAVATLPDGGWDAPHRLLPEQPASVRQGSAPSLAAGAGTAAVVWSQLFDEPDGGVLSELHLARYDEQDGWLPVEEVKSDAQGIVAERPLVGIDGAGVITVLWVQNRRWGEQAVSLMSRRLTSAGWEPTVQVSDPSLLVLWWSQPSLSIAGSHTVVWWSQNNEFIAGNWQDGGWAREHVADSVGAGQGAIIDGVVDPQGRELASWVPDSNALAQLSVRLDGGWQPPIALSSSPSGSFHSAMAMDAVGNGAVLSVGHAADLGGAMYLTQFDGSSLRPRREVYKSGSNLVSGSVALNAAGIGLATWSGYEFPLRKVFAARFEGASPSLEIDTIEGTSTDESQAVVTPKGVRWIFFTSSAGRELIGMVSHCP